MKCLTIPFNITKLNAHLYDSKQKIVDELYRRGSMAGIEITPSVLNSWLDANREAIENLLPLTYGVNEFIAQIKFEIESDINALNEEDDSNDTAILTEEDKKEHIEKYQSKDLQEDQSLYLKSNTLLSTSHLGRFRRQMIRRYLVLTKPNHYKIVSSNEDLNESIVSYKTKLYRTVFNYLLKNNLLTEKDLNAIGISNPQEKSYHPITKIVKTVKDTEKISYRYDYFYSATKANSHTFDTDNEYMLSLLASYLENNDFEAKLMEDWSKLNVMPNEDDYLNPTLLSAVEAFLTLRNFDDLLKQELGDVININKEQKGIEIDPYKDHRNVIKYSIGKDTSTVVKSWNIGEFRDAIAEVTKLQKTILSAISLNDYTSNIITKEHDNIELSELSSAWSALETGMRTVNPNATQTKLTNLKNYLERYTNNPNEYIIEILKLLSDNGVQDELLNKSKILTKRQYNILRSIYEYMYNPNVASSIYNIETKGLLTYYISDILEDVLSEEDNNNKKVETIPLTSLLLLDVLLSTMCRFAPVNYLRSAYSEQVLKTSYIQRDHRVKKQFNDYINRMNQDMKGEPLGSRLNKLDWFGISLIKNNGTFLTSKMNIRFGNETYELSLNTTKISSLMDLSKPNVSYINLRIMDYSIPQFIKNQILTRGLNHLNDKIINPFTNDENDVRTVKEFLEEFFNNPAYYVNNTLILHTKLTNLLKSIFDETTDENSTSINELVVNLLPKINLENILSWSLSQQLCNKILADDDRNLEIKQFFDFIGVFTGLEITTKEGLLTLKHAINNNEEINIISFFNNAVKIALLHAFMSEYLKTDMSTSLEQFVPQSIKKYVNNEVFGRYYFKATHNNDIVPDLYYKSNAYLNGTNEATVGKDANKNQIAFYRNSSLATKYSQLFNDIKADTHAAAHGTLFVEKPNLIADLSYDTDIKENDGTTKLVKTFSTKELIHHQIILKFFNGLDALNLSESVAYILPTVYSDKTAFVTFAIKLFELIWNLKAITALTEDELIDFYFNKIGDYFRKSFSNTQEKFDHLFNWINNNVSNNDLIEKVKKLYTQHLSLKEGFNHLTYLSGLQKILQELTESDLEELIRLHNADLSFEQNKLKFANDTDYRVVNKHLSLNELNLAYSDYFGTSTYTEGETDINKHKENLKKRFKHEIFNFVKELLKNTPRIKYEPGSILGKWINTKTDHIKFQNTEKTGIVNQDDVITWFETDWVLHGNLIIAKLRHINSDGSISYTNITKSSQLRNINEADLVLNPLLEKYFYIDNIYSANLKYALVGSEIADPDKSREKPGKYILDSDKSKIIQNLTLLSRFIGENKFVNTKETDFIKVISNLDFSTFRLLIDQIDALNINPELVNILNNIYEKGIYKIISKSEGALYKRNVIIPGTMNAVNANSITGMGRSVKFAIVKDTKALIFNPNGESAKEDAHDGSGARTALAALLENGSLGPDATGYELAKTLWHYYDRDSGTSFLAKWAVFTLTNGSMRLTRAGEQANYKIFKKMSNIAWDPNVNLVTTTELHVHQDENGNRVRKIDFNELISPYCKGSRVFYKSADRHYEITDFNTDSVAIKDGEITKTFSFYTTIEKQVVPKISEYGSRVALLFDENHESVKIRQGSDETLLEFKTRVAQIMAKNNYHTISTLYELHQAFGGLMSELLINPDSEVVADNLEASENSNYILYAFANNVTIKNTNSQSLHLNLDTYYLPLKECLISYIANPSAIKRNLFNVNSNNLWNADNNQDLIYSEIETKFLGTLLDPDHEADEAEVSEMSQVVASLDSGGAMHNVAKMAFKELGKLALEGMHIEENTLARLVSVDVKDLKQLEKVKSELYHIVVNSLLESFVSRNEFDLATAIINRIKKTFYNVPMSEHNLKDEHNQLLVEEMLLPVSDPNIFKTVVSSFASNLTKHVLKRKYPGLGTVMVPAYNRAQILTLKDNNTELTYTYDDILRKATTKQFAIYQDDGDGNQKVVKLNSGRADFWDGSYKPNSNFVLSFDRKISTGLSFVYNEDGSYTITIGQDFLNKLSENDQLFILSAVQSNLNTGTILQIETEKLLDNLLTNLTNMLSKVGINKFGDNLFTIGSISDDALDLVMVSSYLETELKKSLYLLRSASHVLPTDIINIIDKTTKGNPDGVLSSYIKDIDLNDIDTYYDFDFIFNRARSILLRIFYKLNPHIQSEEEAITELIEDSNLNKYAKLLGISNPKLLTWLKLALQNNVEFQYNITKARNLRPQRITFQATDENGNIIDGNMYLLTCISKAHGYRQLKNIKKNGLNKNEHVIVHPTEDILRTLFKTTEGFKLIGDEQINDIIKTSGFIFLDDMPQAAVILKYIQEHADQMQEGESETDFIYRMIQQGEVITNGNNINSVELSLIALSNLKQQSRKVNIYGKIYDVIEDSILNEEAEILMSNIHKSKFGLGNKTLALMLEGFEPEKFNTHLNLIPTNTLQVNLWLTSRKDSYAISFNNYKTSEYILIRSKELIEDNNIYVRTADNLKLFLVGYLVERKDIIFENGNYYKIKKEVADADGNKHIEDCHELISKDQAKFFIRYNGGIYLKKYFLYDSYKKINNRRVKFLFIRKDVLNEYCSENHLDSTKFLADQIKAFAKYRNLTLTLLNLRLNLKQIDNTLDFLNSLLYNTSTEKVFDTYVKKNIAYLTKLKTTEIFTNPPMKEGTGEDADKKYDNDLHEKHLSRLVFDPENPSTDNLIYDIADTTYLNYTKLIQQAHKIKSNNAKLNFELSRYVIAARIPAQSLQSYMKMKLVGFIPVDKNECMVSHWLTWLQGSDYKRLYYTIQYLFIL